MIKTRKAILLSGTDYKKILNRDNYHISYDLIIGKIRDYLMSSVGGYWGNNEIELISYHAKDDALKKIKAIESDYIFFFFTGHGLFSNNTQRLQLSEMESIALDELEFSAKKTLLMLDCCRRIDGEWRPGDNCMIDMKFIDPILDNTKDTSDAFVEALNYCFVDDNHSRTVVYATSFDAIAKLSLFTRCLIKRIDEWNNGGSSFEILTIMNAIEGTNDLMFETTASAGYIQIPGITNTLEIPFSIRV
jgi:Caspase domain